MTSTAALNRRAKLAEEAQAAGDRVIEAARAWEREREARRKGVDAGTGKGVDLWVAETDLAAAVRDLNARVAKVEGAR